MAASGAASRAIPAVGRSCAELPGDVEPSRHGPRLRALVGMLDQLLGVPMCCGTIAAIPQRLSATLEQPMQEALVFARQQSLLGLQPPADQAAAAVLGAPDRRSGHSWNRPGSPSTGVA